MPTDKIFTIDNEYSIAIYATHAEADLACAVTDQGEVPAEKFTSRAQLAKIARDWPMAKLVETWNMFAGAPPFSDLPELKKFKDRDTALDRIWNQIQRLNASGNHHDGVPAEAQPAIAAELSPVGVAGLQTSQPTPVTEQIASAAAATAPTAGAQAAQGATRELCPHCGRPMPKAGTQRAPRAAAVKAALANIADPEADKSWWDAASKRDRVIALGRRAEGVTLAYVMSSRSIHHDGNYWQIHTARSFLSQGGGVGKAGYESCHSKHANGKDVVYRIYNKSTEAALITAHKAAEAAEQAEKTPIAQAATAPQEAQAPASPAPAPEQR